MTNQLPQQTVKRIEEALELFLNEDAAKLLLDDTQITREHNGISYKMVNKEVALKTMRYLVASEAQRNRELVRVITEEINPSELPMHIADKLKQALKNYQQ